MSSAILERAIKAACALEPPDTGCDYPHCSCSGLPAKIRAALSAALQPDETLVETMADAITTRDAEWAQAIAVLAAQRKAILGDE